MDSLQGVDFLNLNIPSHPSSNKIKLTRLGERMYKIHIKKSLIHGVDLIIGLMEIQLKTMNLALMFMQLKRKELHQ